VFVAGCLTNEVVEIPFSGGSYGTPMPLASGLNCPLGLAVDANGNVFVADNGNNAVKEILFSGGTYGAPVALAAHFHGPFGVAVDQAGRLYVLDLEDIWLLTP
jgi:DNA-binding beta-propeller fold protein YncE